MTRGFRLAISVVAAGALTASVLTGAFAKVPQPFNTMVRTHAKKYSVNGDLTVTSVLKVNKNINILGNTYMRGKSEVWKGLLVRSGGIKADTLSLSGQLQAQSAVIASNLQAGAITGTTLSLTGAATVGGTLTATGKIVGSGVDAGSGGLVTTGTLAAGNSTLGALTTSSITDNGALAASSIQTNGTLNAGATTLSGLTVSGPVNFTNATVTGLNLSNLLQGAVTLSTLQVGASSATTSPLAVVENGKSATIGVNTSGALTTSGDLAVGGNFSVAGSFAPGTLTTANVTAPTASGQTAPGALTLTGNGISLAGNTTLTGGNDLTMSTGTNSASHIVASGDKDLAGSVQLTVTAGTPAGHVYSAGVSFTQAYGSTPIVVVTPAATDPGVGTELMPKYWVTASTGGFTIYYDTPVLEPNAFTVTFNYMVIGS